MHFSVLITSGFWSLHFLFSGCSHHTSAKLFMDTLHNSPVLKNFSKSLFTTWKIESIPAVDLANLDNFEEMKCLVVVTNFIGSNVHRLNQPYIIRKLMPAIFKGWVRYPTIGWTMDYPNDSNFSCLQDNLHHHCEKLDWQKLVLASKAWNCEIRLELFPPFPYTSGGTRSLLNVMENYRGLKSHELMYPGVWFYNVNLTTDGADVPLTSRKPIIQVFLVPSVYWNKSSISEIHLVLLNWLQRRLGTFPATTNIAFVLGEMVENEEHVYSIASIRGLYQETKIDAFTLPNGDSKSLDPDAVYKFQEKIWKRHLHWTINMQTVDGILEKYFKNCENIISGYPKPLDFMTKSLPSFKHIQPYSLVNIWQSILGNFTYNSKCRNGNKIYVGALGGPISTIRYVDTNRMSRLHYPLQILDALESYRFVVCGMKGSDSIAFRELINVYDVYVWGFVVGSVLCIACFWKILTLPMISQVKILKQGCCSNAFSLVKILLEQGDSSVSAKSVKLRLLLGTFVLISIVLSNGYKNANVYNMVAPRNRVRYEKLKDLVEDNFAIYALSTPFWGNWFDEPETNWVAEAENITVTRKSSQELSYYIGDPNHEIVKSVISLPHFEINEWSGSKSHWESDAELHLNKFARNSCLIYFADVLRKLIERFKTQNRNWEKIVAVADKRLSTYISIIAHDGYLETEREFLIAALTKCNKTALTLPVYEAESYARVLTAERGNSGRETFFHRYFVFALHGLVTPPIIDRLARMKGTGILEWWTNITEYISIIKFRSSVNVENTMAETSPEGVSLNGNIVVIFCLLVGGLTASCTGFLLEMAWKVGQIIKPVATSR